MFDVTTYNPLCGLMLFKAFAPILLERKAEKIRKEISGDPEKGVSDVKTVYSNQEGRT